MKLFVLVCAAALLGCGEGYITGSDGQPLTTTSLEGGNASEPGSGGSGGSPAAFCQEACSAPSDCDTSLGYVCLDERCVLQVCDATLTCDADEDCVPLMSGWSFGAACAASADCPAGACVEVAGTGHCATAPSEWVSCATMMMEEVEVTDIEGNAATVCGNTAYRCNAHACWKPCAGDGDCFDPLPHCNATTGVCECTDASCSAATAGGTVCLDSGACGCDADSDCVGTGFDRCVDHACGCAGDASCHGWTLVHPSTSVVCSDQAVVATTDQGCQ